MQPIAIRAAGMVTGVGLNAPASCAAIRCALDKFSETGFMDRTGEWILGSQVSFERPWRGLKKLVKMVVPAIRECLDHAKNVAPESIPLLLCVAEKERVGRLNGLDDELFNSIQEELGIRFHAQSTVIARGRVGGGIAMNMAAHLGLAKQCPFCLIAGVDSLLVAATLADFEEKDRLLTSQNSNGFIPGEAGAAVLVGPPQNTEDQELLCLGIGIGQEKATIYSEEPLRAEGLVQAIRSAFADSQCGFEDMAFRLADANGEQYWFKESALALTRTLRIRKGHFDLWHPADCIGDVGAAAAPCAIGVALAAVRKRYSPGSGVLCHFSGDSGERVALVMSQGERRR